MNKKVRLIQGDNMKSLDLIPDNSIDSVVTDGPYGLTFMNKKWDYDVPSVEFWKKVYQKLKPGGHLLSFGGTRTYHRMVVNMEDAGFEIRDQIMWLYGSGFPKSLNVGKAVDKLEGNNRKEIEATGRYKYGFDSSLNGDIYGKYNSNIKLTKGQSDWEGWGSALKPANEPICLARKPLSEKSIAENVLKWGTGGINVDGCRIATDEKISIHKGKFGFTEGTGSFTDKNFISKGQEEGRFPANIILDEIAAEMLDEQSGISKSTKGNRITTKNRISDSGWKEVNRTSGEISGFSDKGGASRFFYQAKVSKAERNMGLDEGVKSNHPTMKPVALMTYLCRLITPPNGIVLDPFMGSGSTGVSALLEGFRFCGMEMDPDYFKIAEARINSYEDYRKFIKK
jgi:site-specific DNA-methyltransferase (adenine-specific)